MLLCDFLGHLNASLSSVDLFCTKIGECRYSYFTSGKVCLCIKEHFSDDLNFAEVWALLFSVFAELFSKAFRTI